MTATHSEPATRPKLELVIWVLVALLLVPAVLRLGDAWGSTSYLSYGMVFGPLSLYLAWAGRAEMARQPRRTDLRAVPLFALAFSGYLASYVAKSTFGIGAAAIAVVGSGIWMLHGLARLRVMALPLALAFLSIPPPEQFIALLTSGLQALVTDAAIEMLHLFAWPVARDGNVLLIPGGALFVAEACSGIASVFALMPAALVLAYFSSLGPWRGAVLIVCVVPIALMWNLARVVITVVGSIEYGSALVVGELHEPAGLVTFALGCVTLVLLGRMLRPLPPSSARACRPRKA